VPRFTGHQLEDGYDFLTRHDADVFVERLPWSGELTRCGHLAIKRLHTTRWHYYRPACAEDCLVERREEGGSPAVGSVTIFQGCPSGCRRHVSVWRQQMRTWWWGTRWAARRDLIGVAGWFKSLSPIQLIAAAVLLAVGLMPFHGLLDDALEIVKALGR
jgi:hypothetical protein